MYEDGNPAEVFISMAKEGSTISGLMDTFATSVGFALQYGVPLNFSRAGGRAISRFRMRSRSWIMFPLAGGEVPGAGVREDRGGDALEPKPQQELPFGRVRSSIPPGRSESGPPLFIGVRGRCI